MNTEEANLRASYKLSVYVYIEMIMKSDVVVIYYTGFLL